MQYKINPTLLVKKNGQFITIFAGDKSLLYELNQTASFIFLQLKAKKSPESIVRSLIDEFEVKETKARQDFKALIKRLLADEIIVQQEL